MTTPPKMSDLLRASDDEMPDGVSTTLKPGAPYYDGQGIVTAEVDAKVYPAFMSFIAKHSDELDALLNEAQPGLNTRYLTLPELRYTVAKDEQ